MHIADASLSGIIMTRALLLFTSLALLLGCAHLSDAAIRKHLAGTWQVVLPAPNEHGLKMIYTIAPNGDFTRETLMSDADVHGVDMTGTMRIQDGCLIQTTDYMRVRRNARLPQTLRAKIMHADDREMVIVFDGNRKKDTFRKATPEAVTPAHP